MISPRGHIIQIASAGAGVIKSHARVLKAQRECPILMQMENIHYEKMVYNDWREEFNYSISMINRKGS